ncbi:titin, partial [Anoplophora glabripennis]
MCWCPVHLRPGPDSLIRRMSVQFTTDSVDAPLQISHVQAEDEATYKCEITYLEVIDNCDVIQIVKLKTLRKPDTIRVIDGNGNVLSNDTTLSPRKVKAEMELTCEAVGGKPVPNVSWFNGTTHMTGAKYTVTGKDESLTGKSVLKLSLSRGDILATFMCRVESEALDEPVIYSITTDVHVSPTHVNLIDEKNRVVQGMEAKFTCTVPGARPEATVRWKNESSEESTDITPLSNTTYEYDNKTYTTISKLSFNTSYYQNGNRIYCYAQNKARNESGEPELYESKTLDVLYPPVFNFVAHDIIINETSKNNTVDMDCFFIANPQEMRAIVWSKDGKNLTVSDTSKYKGGTVTRPRITIKSVDREDMGEYTCSVRNDVGTETSEGIYLNVQYPPDVEVVMQPAAPVKALEKSTVLLECNVTSGNPSTLEKVRWFLDGQLMKEFPECNYTSYDESGTGEGYGGPFCGLDPSILSLERVDETFSGNYTCQGKNFAGWGNESEPRELIVYYPPGPAVLRYHPSDVVKGGSVTLECIVQNPGNPDNLTYVWYRGVHEMVEVTVSNFTISPVRLETRSNFTCTAVNEGGRSENATVFINVNAPPAFIEKLPTYRGVLYSSKHINLTCKVECYPECSIIWKKDGIILNTDENSLYSVKTTKLPPDYRKNDFESINSTLIWNMDRWPEKQLNKSSPNSHYSCESMNNSLGLGVNSTIEIAVDYPPENVHVSPKIINVVEHQIPSPVKCHGEGRPKLTYKWRKNATSEPISGNEDLVLGPMKRSDTGGYTCEAENKHGTKF